MDEKQKYETMWSFDSYRERSPGMRFLDDALSRLNPKPCASFIDLGCGTGRVSTALADLGYQVTALDIAANACTEFLGPFIESALWDIPDSVGVFDYGFCADVMEHLPTDCVSPALASIKKHVKKCYFQIANFQCHEGDKIGQHLHLTVESCTWWAIELQKHWKNVQIEVMPKHHIAVVW